VPDRFVVKSRAELTPSQQDEYEDIDNYFLVDRQTGEVVFTDSMEPEDATLTRDLKPLVKLVNKLDRANKRELADEDSSAGYTSKT
jgi:hypothetical protein